MSNDWQLYEVVGDGWRLPMHVMDRGGDTVEIERVDGFPYLKSQRSEIESTVAPFAPNVAGCWYVKKSDLGKIAEKSRFTDPEDVVVWRKPEPPIQDDEFFKAYCAWDRSFIGKPEIAMLIWDSFMRFAQHWLLNKQLPVNLGFAKLYALQARVNWKHIVFGRYNGHTTGAKGFSGTADTPMEKLHAELYRLLTASEMTAYDTKSKTVRWTLEVVPDVGFEKTTRVLEEAKKHVPGAGGYFSKINEQLKRQLSNAYQIFRAHVLQARHPMLLLPQDKSQKRANSLVCEKQFRKLFFRPAPKGSTAPAVTGRTQKKSGLVEILGEDEIVSQLPDLRARGGDVRKWWQNVAESAQRENGTAGLPLRDVVQSETGDRGLLALPNDRRDDGMGRSTVPGTV